MKVAIIGAGISGIAVAHRLHRMHEMTVFEAEDRPGGHANTVRVDTAHETHHDRHRVHRLQRPQLPEFQATADRRRGRLATVEHELQRRGRATGTSSTAAPRRTACSPSARTSRRRGSTGWCSTWRASTVPPASCSPPMSDGPSLGDVARAAALLPAVHRAADRAAGRRRVVGRPGADVELPRALPGRVLRQPRDARFVNRAAVADDPRRLAQLRRGADAPLARPLRFGCTGHARSGDRAPTTCRSQTRTPRFETLRPRRARDPLRPGACSCCGRGGREHERRCSARSRTRPTRRSCTPTRGCSHAVAARGRAGTTTCSSEPTGPRRGDLSPQPPPGDRRARAVLVTLNRTAAIDPAKMIRTHRVRPPRVHATRACEAQARHAEIDGRNRTSFCGAWWGSGLPRGRRRQRRCASADAYRSGCMSDSCIYEGTLRHRRFEVAERGSRTGWRSRTSISTSCRRCSAGGSCAARPGSCGSAGATTSARPRCRSRDAVRDRGGGIPRRPDPACLTQLRSFGTCFNPVSFYYCFGPDGERPARGVLAEVTNTPWGERAQLRAARGRAGTPSWPGVFDKQMHVSPFMGMDHRYCWRLAAPGETLSVHIENQTARAGWRSTRPWRCAASS